MKYSELAHKTSDELHVLLREYQTKLVQLKFDMADKKLQDTSAIRETRRTIAQILTQLRQIPQ